MKSDDLFFPAIIIVLGLWLIFGEDTESVYPLTRNETPEAGEPAWLPGAQTVYKIRGNQIVAKFGSIVGSYENYRIFLIENLQCEYSDGSGSFGIRDGDYWEHPPFHDTRYVSWLRHAIEGCKWEFHSGGFQVLSCPMRFVM